MAFGCAISAPAEQDDHTRQTFLVLCYQPFMARSRVRRRSFDNLPTDILNGSYTIDDVV